MCAHICCVYTHTHTHICVYTGVYTCVRVRISDLLCLSGLTNTQGYRVLCSDSCHEGEVTQTTIITDGNQPLSRSKASVCCWGF